MKQNLGLRITVTAVGLILAITHVHWPHLNIDSIAVALLVIAALPWLQPLVKTVEVPGLKVELQDLRDKVNEVKVRADDAKGAAESATLRAAYALSASSTPATSTTMRAESPLDHGEMIAALSKQYEEVRDTQSAGDARTRAMTDVIRRMIELAKSVESFDVAAALNNPSRGMRLFAYAWLTAKPDPRFLVPLVETVCRKEDTPFGQFWGLQAVGPLIDRARPVSADVKSMLEEFAAKLPPGTDRAYEVKKLLRQVE